MTKCILHYPADRVQQVIKCSFAGMMQFLRRGRAGGEEGIERIIEMYNY